MPHIRAVPRDAVPWVRIPPEKMYTSKAISVTILLTLKPGMTVVPVAR